MAEAINDEVKENGKRYPQIYIDYSYGTDKNGALAYTANPGD